MPIEWFLDQIQIVRGKSCFLFFARCMANPDKKSGEKQRDTEHGAARIGWQGARSCGIELTKNVSQKRECPHAGIGRRRKGVKHDSMRSWESGGKWLCQECGEIAQVQFPIYRLGDVAKTKAMVAQKLVQAVLIAVKIAKRLRMLEGKLERLECLFEADDMQRTRQLLGGSQNDKDICSGAQTDIPKNKRSGSSLESFNEL